MALCAPHKCEVSRWPQGRRGVLWRAAAGYGRTIEAMPDQEKSPRPIAIPDVREDIRRIATAHGAGNVRVFGSTGRGEQGASSDLDLLVDMAEGRSLFDLI